MRALTFAVLCLLAAPTAHAAVCTGAIDWGQCEDRIGEATYEAWAVADAARTFCPGLTAGDFRALLRDAENRARDRAQLIERKRAAWRLFTKDPARACRTAYELYGPGGSMTDLFGGPIIHVRAPPKPGSFREGYDRGD